MAQNQSIKTPVVFLIFKRPAETARVFAEIRKARPAQLLIVADGPRNSDEKKSTDATRKVVEDSVIDWPCEVKRNYSDVNLGCRKRIWSGLNWAFEQVDKAIILEDDCLPEQSFFPFATDMLERYKDDERIMHIGGVNFSNVPVSESYYFSRIAQIWGWATWKRAWKKYDGRLDSWPQTKNSAPFKKIFHSQTGLRYWTYLFDRMHNNELDTWDIAWTYTCFKEGRLSIVPKYNLISNIGFNAQHATHGAKLVKLANAPTKALLPPYTAPKLMQPNIRADRETYANVFGIQPTIGSEIKNSIKTVLHL